MTYETVANTSSMVALFIFIALFAAACFSALRPRNRPLYEQAALIPFDDTRPAQQGAEPTSLKG